ncbi:MAG: hypothetical protein C4523_20885 [Myxococcales bacterium]|nr:MAG: hypothetical protein C4523_20885 [Myxococcales bacterium]
MIGDRQSWPDEILRDREPPMDAWRRREENCMPDTPPLIFRIVLAGISLWMAFGVASCASKGSVKSETHPKYIIHEIDLQGVTRFKKSEFLKYLYMDETSWWTWTGLTDTYYFSKGFSKDDAKRIEELYKSFGYYQAAVKEIRMEPLKEGSDEVRVTIVVDEGEPILVRLIVVAWTDGAVSQKEVEAAITLKQGARFEIRALNRSVEKIRLVLESGGYGLAAIQESAEVDRDRHWADVAFSVSHGPYCRIGRIRYSGLSAIPSHLLDAEIDFAPGKPYSPELLTRIEKAIYAMDAFNSVSVSPDKELGPDGQLGLLVQVVEGNPQRLKVGIGIGIESNRWDSHLSLFYTHRNISGDLVRFDLAAKAGYALLPYPWEPNEHGPILKLEPHFTKKGWLEPKLIWTIKPSFALDIQEGYQYYTPSLRFGVSRFLFGFTLAEASYNAQFFDFFSQSSLFQLNKTVLGRDFQDPYFLDYLEFRYTLFFTDDFFNPKNGVIIDAIYDISGAWLGSFYDYHKITPEIKAYWQVFSHLQAAARASTGYIFPYGMKPGAPISMKYYLGGGDTVRGWGLKRLSPRIEDCDPSGKCSSLPVGGKTMALGNVELRFKTIDVLYVVPFFDVGDVQSGEMEYKPSQWSYSTGGGLRYDSPVGKLRLDFGYRLNTFSRFSGDARWAIHFSFGDAF